MLHCCPFPVQHLLAAASFSARSLCTFVNSALFAFVLDGNLSSFKTCVTEAEKLALYGDLTIVEMQSFSTTSCTPGPQNYMTATVVADGACISSSSYKLQFQTFADESIDFPTGTQYIETEYHGNDQCSDQPLGYVYALEVQRGVCNEYTFDGGMQFFYIVVCMPYVPKLEHKLATRTPVCQACTPHLHHGRDATATESRDTCHRPTPPVVGRYCLLSIAQPHRTDVRRYNDSLLCYRRNRLFWLKRRHQDGEPVPWKMQLKQCENMWPHVHGGMPLCTLLHDFMRRPH